MPSATRRRGFAVVFQPLKVAATDIEAYCDTGASLDPRIQAGVVFLKIRVIVHVRIRAGIVRIARH